MTAWEIECGRFRLLSQLASLFYTRRSQARIPAIIGITEIRAAILFIARHVVGQEKVMPQRFVETVA